MTQLFFVTGLMAVKNIQYRPVGRDENGEFVTVVPFPLKGTLESMGW